MIQGRSEKLIGFCTVFISGLLFVFLTNVLLIKPVSSKAIPLTGIPDSSRICTSSILALHSDLEEWEFSIGTERNTGDILRSSYRDKSENTSSYDTGRRVDSIVQLEHRLEDSMREYAVEMSRKMDRAMTHQEISPKQSGAQSGGFDIDSAVSMDSSEHLYKRTEELKCGYGKAECREPGGFAQNSVTVLLDYYSIRNGYIPEFSKKTRDIFHAAQPVISNHFQPLTPETNNYQVLAGSRTDSPSYHKTDIAYCIRSAFYEYRTSKNITDKKSGEPA